MIPQTRRPADLEDPEISTASKSRDLIHGRGATAWKARVGGAFPRRERYSVFGWCWRATGRVRSVPCHWRSSESESESESIRVVSSVDYRKVRFVRLTIRPDREPAKLSAVQVEVSRLVVPSSRLDGYRYSADGYFLLGHRRDLNGGAEVSEANRGEQASEHTLVISDDGSWCCPPFFVRNLLFFLFAQSFEMFPDESETMKAMRNHNRVKGNVSEQRITGTRPCAWCLVPNGRDDISREPKARCMHLPSEVVM
jgi:hypothetical protein